MSDVDPSFTVKIAPVIAVAADSIVRVLGMALLSKGIIDQHGFDTADSGAVYMVAGSLMYGAARIVSYFKTAKAVAAAVKTQVVDQVKTQVAEQVPVAVTKELNSV